jgi:flagellar basal body-associated protein FliL
MTNHYKIKIIIILIIIIIIIIIIIALHKLFFCHYERHNFYGNK